MILTNQESQEILWGENDEYEIVSDDVEDNDRWSIHHCLVVKHLPTDKFYQTYYSVGATEQQDESPFELGDDKNEWDEVEQVEVLTKVWKAVS